MARDIDYAAIAVNNAIVEKFGRANELTDLEVVANDQTISVRHAGQVAEGTRDNLLAAVRAADTYAQLWIELAPQRNPSRPK
ncbi:MAG: hypothetical protein AB7O59_24245 [Pirellulales bacterium]